MLMSIYPITQHRSSRAEQPTGNFDPAAYPIIAEHWYGLRPVGNAAAEAIERIGRIAITNWLSKASKGRGRETAHAFRQADHIRRRLGLRWNDLVDERSAA